MANDLRSAIRWHFRSRIQIIALPMAVPGYQQFMLPLLRVASDGKEHSLASAVATLADQLKLSDEDREAVIPSGQTRLYNRVAWAVTYLGKSLLLEKTGRGRFKIAPRGAEALKKNPSRIDNKFLDQFPEYQAFKAKKIAKLAAVVGKSDGDAETVDPDITPDEQLDAAYKELRETLADELLHRVRTGTPKFFEHLVVDLLVAMGYGGSRVDAAQVVGKSGDGGIDGVIKEDRLGLDMVYVQAKRHENDIGPGSIREFVGALGEHRANKGVFITSGGFTSGARDAASKAHSRIVLIDGEQLAEFMIDHGVGVTDHKTYTMKKLDGDYFDGV
jgi:restriction system protein